MSVGVAFAPTHGTLLTDLLHCADVAMYQAKQRRTGVQVSRPADATTEHARLGLLGDLARAIESDELRVHFRPQQRLGSGAIDRVAGVSRMAPPRARRHPVRRIRGSGRAHRTRRTAHRFVVEHAARALVGLDRPELGVAIGVPSRLLQTRTFADDVIATLARVGLEPSTGRAGTQPNRRSRSRASRAERTSTSSGSVGVTFSVEVFETDTSSFATLLQHRNRSAHVERGVPRGAAHDTSVELITKAVIQVAHGRRTRSRCRRSGLRRRFRNSLVTLDCDLAQGRLIGAAVPIDALEAWLDTTASESANPSLIS